MERRFNLALVFSVVSRNVTANRHASTWIDQLGNRLGNFTADVFKVNVDAFRAGSSQISVQVTGFVIDTSVKTQLFNHVTALVWTTGDTHYVAAFFLGSLTNYGTDWTGSRSNDNSLASFRLTHVHQAAIASAPRHARDAKIRLQWSALIFDLVDHRRVTSNDEVFLPAGIHGDQIANAVFVGLAFNYAADALTDDRRADFNRVHIAFAVVHAWTHVRIQ